MPTRYGIARSALYTRMKDLGIKPEREGKQAFISADQLHQLDALHEHLRNGGTTGEFQIQTSIGQVEDRSTEPSKPLNLLMKQLAAELAEAKPEIKLLLTAISHLLLAKAHYFEPNINPFKCRLLLKEAASSECVLSTSELIAILKIEKIPRLREGKFARKGFLFSRIERNTEIPRTSGREAEWKVSQLDYGEEN